MGLLTGRETIALKSGDDEVELNVSTNFDYSYPAEVTKHPIEKEDGSKQTVTDHVILGDRSISIQCVLSTTTEIFSLKRMTVDAKLKQLIIWQSKGQLLTMLGYTTNGIISKLLAALPSLFQYVEPEDEMERYLGRSIDEIPNLLLGPLSFSENVESGNDIPVTILLSPALIVESKTKDLTRVPSKGKIAKQKETKAIESPAKTKIGIFKSLLPNG